MRLGQLFFGCECFRKPRTYQRHHINRTHQKSVSSSMLMFRVVIFYGTNDTLELHVSIALFEGS